MGRLFGRADPAGAPPAGEVPNPGRAMLRDALATKVLHDWAQNRQQVMVPLAVNLSRLEPPQRALIAGVMVAGLAAGGAATERDRRRLVAVLARIGGDPAEAGLAAERPPDLLPLLAAVEAQSLGAHAYAASLMVLDRQGKVARAWLGYLAARFGLPAETVARLGRRYRG